VGIFYIDTNAGQFATHAQLRAHGLLDANAHSQPPWHRLQATGDASTLWYALMRKQAHARGRSSRQAPSGRVGRSPARADRRVPRRRTSRTRAHPVRQRRLGAAERPARHCGRRRRVARSRSATGALEGSARRLGRPSRRRNAAREASRTDRAQRSPGTLAPRPHFASCLGPEGTRLALQVRRAPRRLAVGQRRRV
jgi:hypothetical protein